MARDETLPSNQWFGRIEDHPIYHSWANMKIRCSYPSDPRYKDYGGRGITVCERWRRSFWDFLDDVGNKPSDDMSLDRIEVDGNYEPGNVRWATAKTQANNTRKAKALRASAAPTIIGGFKAGVPAKHLAEQTGVSYQRVRNLLRREGLWVARPRAAQPRPKRTSAPPPDLGAIKAAHKQRLASLVAARDALGRPIPD